MKKHMDKLLDAPAIVLANLCVSYIMTSLNEEAEELMRAVEKVRPRAATRLSPNSQEGVCCGHSRQAQLCRPRHMSMMRGLDWSSKR